MVDQNSRYEPGNNHEPDAELSPVLTRRRFLQAAGGITFLGLAPVASARGLFAVAQAGQQNAGAANLPLFTALPYLQPGPDSSKLVAKQETMLVAWQTDGMPADFVLAYGKGGNLTQTATITQRLRYAEGTAPDKQRRNYAAVLNNLELGQRYDYRVTINGQKLLEGYATTRKPRGAKVHFVSFGDNADGRGADRKIAYQAYRVKPDFIMNTGDNVYENGLDSEYAGYFFPVYNADKADPKTGAPLLRSVPYYTVIANHDVHNKDTHRHPIVDFDANPDGLAYYTSLHLPANGPVLASKTPITGQLDRIKDFTNAAGSRYPNQANYAFDYGDGHFLCLDSNVYVDPTDPALAAWIESDLSATDAAWKIVVYHHPAFNAGYRHYSEQQMRVLSPLFEKHGVALCLHGHEHNYQRTRPFRFAPGETSAAKSAGEAKRFVPGTFTVDRKFDGKDNTKPDGIIYLVTGAGGNDLYDPDCNNNPPRWQHPEDGHADYVARFISDRHSFTVLDMDARSLSLTQIDEDGKELDRFRITKA